MPYYRKRPLVVEAIQLKRNVVVRSGGGLRHDGVVLEESVVHGAPGDWLVKGLHAEYIVPAEQFDELYEADSTADDPFGVSGVEEIIRGPVPLPDAGAPRTTMRGAADHPGASLVERKTDVRDGSER